MVYIGVIDPAESKYSFIFEPTPSLSFWLFLSENGKKSEKLVVQIVNPRQGLSIILGVLNSIPFSSITDWKKTITTQYLCKLDHMKLHIYSYNCKWQHQRSDQRRSQWRCLKALPLQRTVNSVCSHSHSQVCKSVILVHLHHMYKLDLHTL
mgnify:FL=1